MLASIHPLRLDQVNGFALYFASVESVSPIHIISRIIYIYINSWWLTIIDSCLIQILTIINCYTITILSVAVILTLTRRKSYPNTDISLNRSRIQWWWRTWDNDSRSRAPRPVLREVTACWANSRNGTCRRKCNIPVMWCTSLSVLRARSRTRSLSWSTCRSRRYRW